METVKAQGLDTLMKALAAAVEAKPPIASMLVGETGTGKTTAVKQLATERGVEFIRVNLSGHTDVGDIVGRWVVKGGQMEWVDGVLTYALRQGAWILFDEYNAALPETLFVLQSVLDNDMQLRLLDKDGELVSAHEGFRFFATMNPSGGLYGGTKDVNAAQLDRFGVVYEVGYVEPAVEVNILRQSVKHLSEEHAVIMVDYANKVRALKKGDKILRSVSTRALQQWGELTKEIGFYDAFIVAVLNKFLDEAEQDLVRKVFEETNKSFKSIFSKYKVKSYSSILEAVQAKIEKAAEIDKLVEDKRLLIEGVYAKTGRSK